MKYIRVMSSYGKIIVQRLKFKALSFFDFFRGSPWSREWLYHSGSL